MTTEISTTTTTSESDSDLAIANAFAEYLVLSRSMEMMRKKSDDELDEPNSGGADGLVNKEVACRIAQIVTGFGE